MPALIEQVSLSEVGCESVSIYVYLLIFGLDQRQYIVIAYTLLRITNNLIGFT